uniref:Uncharacterized protein n=1 Tax=Haptolina brevifila TaxID=156173 RepID=A0A7S2JI25_9EUKA|mmetsp:Transcript_83002/g.165710  ORF Transcript_83002/g.165710 Transcript_83002/m.165710 type:complete len:157 (+) Transcript_83002:948-1418(+)
MRTVRNAPLLLVAMRVAFCHPTSGLPVRVEIEEPVRFSAFSLLPTFVTHTKLEVMAAVIRAGQRVSDAWKARWADYCVQHGAWEGAPAGGERDAMKHPLASLRAFFDRVGAEFEGAPWLPAEIYLQPQQALQSHDSAESDTEEDGDASTNSVGHVP